MVEADLGSGSGREGIEGLFSPENYEPAAESARVVKDRDGERSERLRALWAAEQMGECHRLLSQDRDRNEECRSRRPDAVRDEDVDVISQMI
uniref:Uncharacterized protein n=1 Tax=Parascaris univalens TaxID=6257 RepID=A0A914ZR92_PARUN